MEFISVNLFLVLASKLHLKVRLKNIVEISFKFLTKYYADVKINQNFAINDDLSKYEIQAKNIL